MNIVRWRICHSYESRNQNICNSPYQTYRKREKKKFAKVLPLGNGILKGKAYG